MYGSTTEQGSRSMEGRTGRRACDGLLALHQPPFAATLLASRWACGPLRCLWWKKMLSKNFGGTGDCCGMWDAEINCVLLQLMALAGCLVAPGKDWSTAPRNFGSWRMGGDPVGSQRVRGQVSLRRIASEDRSCRPRNKKGALSCRLV